MVRHAFGRSPINTQLTEPEPQQLNGRTNIIDIDTGCGVSTRPLIRPTGWHVGNKFTGCIAGIRSSQSHPIPWQIWRV